VVVGLLLVLSALAWFATARLSTPEMRLGVLTGSGSMDGMSSMEGMGSTPQASMAPALFMATWMVMMVAMMSPAVSPVVITFDRWLARTGRSRAATLVFVAAYLAVWGAAGLLAYGGMLALQAWLPSDDGRAIRAGGVILALAGAYQLTPLKNACLRHCRSPLALLASHAERLRDGLLGPVRVGIRHALYCLGCCWSLMVVLVLLGMMNLGWMALVAAVILVEKTTPRGVLVSCVVGFALLGAGVVVAVWPGVAPAAV
jgi:predicted metal-binding membrane protein